MASTEESKSEQVVKNDGGVSDKIGAAAIKKLWDEVENLECEDEAVDLIETFVYEHKDDRPEILLTKSPDGVSLTEYVCSVESNASVRDALDDIIEAKVPVTERCYKEVLDQYYLSIDMLVSLLKSGYLPHTINDSKPLDCIIEALEGNSYFEEAPEEILSLFQEGGSITPKVGVTHDANGSFAQWFASQEGGGGKDTDSNEGEGSDDGDAEDEKEDASEPQPKKRKM